MKNTTKKLLATLFFLSMMGGVSKVSAQQILFNFDSATDHTPLPISIYEKGVMAYFAGGYSIQDVYSPVVPSGFSGLFLYPNSVYGSDLQISFNKTITDFSIWYSCQELACDDAATMLAIAYLKGKWVDSATRMTNHPGTWPVDTLRCSSPEGFDSVVVHYYKRPPTCQDYGVVFLCDNMRVTPSSPTGINDSKKILEGLTITNPVSQSATISFFLLQSEKMDITVYDMTGKVVSNLFNGPLNTGEHKIIWNVKDEAVKNGVYILNITGGNFSETRKLIVVK